MSQNLCHTKQNLKPIRFQLFRRRKRIFGLNYLGILDQPPIRINGRSVQKKRQSRNTSTAVVIIIDIIELIALLILVGPGKDHSASRLFPGVDAFSRFFH